jgi:hypothetical protein
MKFLLMSDEYCYGKHRKIEGVKVVEGSRSYYPVKRGFLKSAAIWQLDF